MLTHVAIHEVEGPEGNAAESSSDAGWEAAMIRPVSQDSGQCRVMLVTGVLERSPTGGRALLSRLNHDALAEVFGSRLLRVEVEPRRLNGWRSITSAFTGQIDGLDSRVIAGITSMARKKGVCKVFLDGSNLGKLALAIKRRCPEIEVSTFFHNCEARFFLGALRQRSSVRALGVLLANYLAERSAVRFSDQRICLNGRDSGLLQRLYGKGATHLSAMAMHDRFRSESVGSVPTAGEPYALFVGGTFYANRQGIEWYVDRIAAQAPIMTYVVGKGFERWKDRLERNGNVRVVGAVDDLAPWYLGAQFVIAPIFDGSGMKTKVAEALMFGKRIVGTPEAFAGYEGLGEDIGAVCATAAEFIAALESETSGAPPRVDPRLREIYEENYSYDAAKTRLAAILGN